MQTNKTKDSNSSEKSQMNLEEMLQLYWKEIQDLKKEIERLKPKLMYNAQVLTPMRR